MVLQNFYLIGIFLILQVFHIIFRPLIVGLNTHYTLKICYLNRKGRKVWHIDDTKRELAQANLLPFWIPRLDRLAPAATLHFQNTIHSENYTPGRNDCR